MLFCVMRVSVEEIIELTTVLDVLQQTLIVAVDPGNLASFQLDVAERFLQRCSDGVDRLRKLARSVSQLPKTKCVVRSSKSQTVSASSMSPQCRTQ